MQLASNVNKPRLALIEDDPEQREALHAWLQINTYPCWSTDSAEAYYKIAAVDPVDIVIIDLGLPGEDGTSVIQHLRKYSSIGIIIVSARSSSNDRVYGLECGADMYLVKPVVPEELLSCIDSLWRRLKLDPMLSSDTPHPADVEKTPDSTWRICCNRRHLISPNGASVKLTPSELSIMKAFVQAQGTLSRCDLITALGADPKSFQMNRIDVHLSRLRSKVADSCQIKLPVTPLPGARLEFVGKIELS
ncbi:response regulator transcription factor [Nitrincola sp. A-D6]|uniref:response regulator transcription factor n=1 Tax=Nitrincola sp. A-D6 TaxID=1545442 RepID=UPI00068B3DCF|nr:response regulator transcription factor [Nitrincola sp. A-D6]